MSSLQTVRPDSLIVGYDFSTGGVKALAFDLNGEVVARTKLPTDLWTDDTGVFELNMLLLEGQARAATRALADELGVRANQWTACGISATHHTAGRIDRVGNPIRRAIGWDDKSLAPYYTAGLKELGGEDVPPKLTGGPWAMRYTLTHYIKDETNLSEAEWRRTALVLPHGPLAAGYLTGRFGVTSISSAASTGIMNLETGRWCRAMLDAIKNPEYRELAWRTLPAIIDMHTPVGPLAEHVALDAKLPPGVRPLVFPTLDDQAAGLLGGGAVDSGHLAVILGNSAVVNSSSASPPKSGKLDVMRLNWGPYLWMRCYSNGAQFVDHVVGKDADWGKLEAAGREVDPLCGGVWVMPFFKAEESIGVKKPWHDWVGDEPSDEGVRVRAAFEALAYLIALGVREHEKAGQTITRITVSGGNAKSDLMCDILASVLDRELDRLVSDEGTALGAAVVALAGLEQSGRTARGICEPFAVGEAASAMVKFRPERAQPQAEWVKAYRNGLTDFEARLAVWKDAQK